MLDKVKCVLCYDFRICLARVYIVKPLLKRSCKCKEKVVHKPDRDSFISILNARAKSRALERPIHDQIIYTRLESQIMVSKLHLSTCTRSVGVSHKFSISRPCLLHTAMSFFCKKTIVVVLYYSRWWHHTNYATLLQYSWSCLSSKRVAGWGNQKYCLNAIRNRRLSLGCIACCLLSSCGTLY
jgi:hypothetical protein